MEKIYRVLVTEYLQRTVSVKARNEKEALKIVESDYDSANFVLEPEDSQGAEFFIVSSHDLSEETGVIPEWRDYK